MHQRILVRHWRPSFCSQQARGQSLVSSRLSAAHTGLDLPVTALVAIAVASLVTWLVLLLVSRASAKASEDGSARDMVTRFMGLIVLSMGVQFALTGLHKFWTA